ncbi:MAG: DUF4397 domain-containing protein [Fimbriimonadaceae bacterium]|nr:DUF4397 domain-containing protein [Fimbriimonadaceae bacterium]
MNMKIGWNAGLLLVVAFSLSACGGGGGGQSINKPRLRYVNASPDVNPLSFLIDGSIKTTGIAYLGISPAFVDEDAKEYDMAVREDGELSDLDSVVTGFENEKEYLVCVAGLKNFGSEFVKRLRLVTPQIDLTAPNGNKSRIYVFHAFLRSSGLDTPNIDLRNPGDNPQYKVENIAFASTGNLTIDSSTQTFVARRNDSESVYATQTFTFAPGGIYLAIVAGVEGQVGVQAPKIEFIKLN